YNHAYIRTYANILDETVIADGKGPNTLKIARQTTESAPRNSQSAMPIQKLRSCTTRVDGCVGCATLLPVPTSEWIGGWRKHLKSVQPRRNWPTRRKWPTTTCKEDGTRVSPRRFTGCRYELISRPYEALSTAPSSHTSKGSLGARA